MWSSGVQVGLFAVDVLVALTAIPGGIALVTGLERNRYPLDMLKGTPFRSYVIPGLILAIVVGGSAAVAAAAIVLSPDVGVIASIVAGVIMMGWIVGEILILKQPFSRGTLLEVFYFAVGLAMVVLALIIGRV